MFIIAAVDNTWGIGRENKLLIPLKPDLIRFKYITKGKTVIMGRKTLESLPGGKPLPMRRNIVLSRSADKIPGVEYAFSIDEVLSLIKDLPEDEAAVIGGSSVYAQLLPHASYALITKIHKNLSPDCFFPNLDEHPGWIMTQKEEDLVYEGTQFCYTRYEKLG